MKRLFLVFGVGLILVVGGLAVVVFFRSDNTVMIHSRDGRGVLVRVDEVEAVWYEKDDRNWEDKGIVVLKSGRRFLVSLDEADEVLKAISGVWGRGRRQWWKEREDRVMLRDAKMAEKYLREQEVRRMTPAERFDDFWDARLNGDLGNQPEADAEVLGQFDVEGGLPETANEFKAAYQVGGYLAELKLVDEKVLKDDPLGTMRAVVERLNEDKGLKLDVAYPATALFEYYSQVRKQERERRERSGKIRSRGK